MHLNFLKQKKKLALDNAKVKLQNPGSVASYGIQPGNVAGLSIYKSSYLAFLTGTRLVEAACQQAG